MRGVKGGDPHASTFRDSAGLGVIPAEIERSEMRAGTHSAVFQVTEWVPGKRTPLRVAHFPG